jgi:hypothetical protein
MSMLPEASREFFVSIMRGHRVHDFELTPEFVAKTEAYREEVREEEGGGGMCHIVTEYLAEKYGWERLFVSYLAPNGDIICGGGHVINVLPDGSILDPTRDQFGEGFSVSHIKNDSDEIGRYRPEFYVDYHPGHPDAAALDAWLPYYDGVPDEDVDTMKNGTRGPGWWLSDKACYNAYIDRQNEFNIYGRTF